MSGGTSTLPHPILSPNSLSSHSDHAKLTPSLEEHKHGLMDKLFHHSKDSTKEHEASSEETTGGSSAQKGQGQEHKESEKVCMLFPLLCCGAGRPALQEGLSADRADVI